MAHEKILVVEDEKDLVKLLRYNLEKEGYRVLSAADGESALELARSKKPDFIVLDVMLPRLNGFEFCKMIRRESNVPILMLTAKKEEVDRVIGLELGADDYVTKPFSVREVIARIKAVLRRGADMTMPATILRAGHLTVDLERYEVRVKSRPAPLTTKEFDLLKHLIQAHGAARSRDQLLEQVWGHEQAQELDTRTVDQHIARLREKLGPEAGRVITVKNIGYRLNPD